MTSQEHHLKIVLETAKQKSMDGQIYVVWREDYRHDSDQFIISTFDEYLEEACLMAIEYGQFELGKER